LNRVSFLRPDHSFLAQAFDHGTTKFMVFKNLSPLVKTPSEISYASYSELKSLIPTNPYEKPEEDLIKEFDSRKKIPQLVFLGLDERVKDGLSFKNYTGAPHFAFDITPVAPYEEAANGILAEMEKNGLSFVEGMRAMSFPADVGKKFSLADVLLR
jgi:NAD+ diphosphatase